MNKVGFFLLFFHIKEFQMNSIKFLQKKDCIAHKIQTWYRKQKIIKMLELYFDSVNFFIKHNMKLSIYYITEYETFDYMGFLSDYNLILKTEEKSND